MNQDFVDLPKASRQKTAIGDHECNSRTVMFGWLINLLNIFIEKGYFSTGRKPDSIQCFIVLANPSVFLFVIGIESGLMSSRFCWLQMNDT